MIFKAEIDVMPLKALLDPQGKAVSSGLKNMGFHAITDVRIGKHISLEIDCEDEATARETVESACKGLLVNHVMEYYEYSIKAL